ncbi:DUF58 domain-containing protein [Clostridium lundense]|uniref:DUF58 domain-containing protein n=1 Tax=Clostridium lundense TaxID=319475 RepID=UPI000488ED7E|nr:DUF58 domain-containing protein [Clostridium lundense]
MIKVGNKNFLVLFCISFIYAYLQGGNLPYSIFYALLCIVSFSLIYVLIIGRNIVIDIKFSRDTFYTFEDTEIHTVIKNYGILPVYYIEMHNTVLYELDKSYKGYVFSLDMDANKRLNTKVRFFTRGIYNFGESKLYFKDFFSLFNFEKVIKKRNIIKVYPKIYHLDKFNFSGEDLFNTTIKEKGNIREDYSISDIRKYRTGDNLRNIHWKISAKYGELYTKNLEMVNGEKTNIILNMNKEDYFNEKSEEKEEELIDLTSSLINMMIVRGIKSNLHICNNEMKSFSVSKRNDFQEIMEYFLMHKSEGEEDFFKFIIDNLNRIDKNSFVILITPKINEQIKDNLIYLRRLGYKILAFYSVSSFDNIENVSTLKEMNIRCISFNEAIG